MEKKRHTIKHNLICTKNKFILYSSKAYNGATHDKKIADEEQLVFSKDKKITLNKDTGFQGYEPENVTCVQPTKKPKGAELSPEQKQMNKTISSKRILIEHAIGGVKILRILKDELRIYKEKTRNLIMQIACAIHNLKMNIKS